MTQKVKIIARTVEAPVEGITKEWVSFNEDIMKDEAITLSGKAAGICYMPDDYLSIGIQNESAARKRANGNTESGHYSVFEHAHFSFIVETSKAMAMVLNSTKLYSTSEKSGRYTSMNPETEIEKKYYDKWTSKLFDIIKEKFGSEYTEKEAHKLALENARYFLSVFTPTVMMFTVPFNRVILICEWLDKLHDTIKKMINDLVICPLKNKSSFIYYNRIAEEAQELAEEFRKSLNLSKEEPLLVDHKDIGINFFNTVSVYERKDFIKGRLHSINDKDICSTLHKNWVYNDMYGMNNQYSFACLAQEQRHRTIDYKILNIFEDSYYTPEILSDVDKAEWIADMKDIYENSSIVVQGTMVYVHESGTFDNFYLKCKERVCMRAQKEIMDITVNQIMTMYGIIYNDLWQESWEKLSPLNMSRLLSMIDTRSSDTAIVLPRCMWRGYTCKEHCKHVTYECTRDRLL